MPAKAFVAGVAAIAIAAFITSAKADNIVKNQLVYRALWIYRNAPARGRILWRPCPPRRQHPSNNLAKLPFDPSVRVPRTRLRPHYGDGFDGAPLMVRRSRGEGRAVGGGADDPARPANPAAAAIATAPFWSTLSNAGSSIFCRIARRIASPLGRGTIRALKSSPAIAAPVLLMVVAAVHPRPSTLPIVGTSLRTVARRCSPSLSAISRNCERRHRGAPARRRRRATHRAADRVSDCRRPWSSACSRSTRDAP